MLCSSGNEPACRGQDLNVTLTCPRYVQKVRVKLCKCLGENGRHEETRTPDLYRVNFEVRTLKPFPHLAFPHFKESKIASKLPSFDGELMASFCASIGDAILAESFLRRCRSGRVVMEGPIFRESVTDTIKYWGPVLI